MSKYAEIRNDYINEEENAVYIDAWLTDNDNEEGTVIAKVKLDTLTVEYLDKDAKTDEYAQEIIQEILIKSGVPHF